MFRDRSPLAEDTLTVILRNDDPTHWGGSPSFRSVRVKLTEEQRNLLATASNEWVDRVILDRTSD